jgi:hypothetical protein
MSRISVVVDARDAGDALFPDGDVAPFLRNWADLESQLRGRTLQSGVIFSVPLPSGKLKVEIIGPDEPVIVDERAEFGIVAVRERPQVRDVYLCSTCRRDGDRKYGPFICVQCPQDDRRICDRHAVVLPGALAAATGALTANCPAHRPMCACGRTAAIWCSGPNCGSRVAWCAAHAAAHSSDPATLYCGRCLAEKFAPCGLGRCDAIGSIRCDHLDDAGRLCGAPRCPRHARRWQVFGPHSEGLGRCESHAVLQGKPADWLLYQVLGACSVRRLRPPTLGGLRHMLLKLTGQARPMDSVLTLALRTSATAPALTSELRALTDKQAATWGAAAAAAAASADQQLAQLKDWLNRQGQYNAATVVTATHWVRPRDDRPGVLRVRCDPRLLPRYLRDQAGAALGFEVRMEKLA